MLVKSCDATKTLLFEKLENLERACGKIERNNHELIDDDVVAILGHGEELQSMFSKFEHD